VVSELEALCCRSAFNERLAVGTLIDGSTQCGLCAFYDYDGEPIYIGQTDLD
jgi:hypothetical protein